MRLLALTGNRGQGLPVIDERLGTYFWLSEFVRSDIATRKGLDNMPDAAALSNIRVILAPGMERVRNALGSAVLITSGYRAPAVNRAVGGAKSSQHLQGLAADFICPQFGTPRAVCLHLLRQNLHFDQLIYEGTWVHISFADKPRGEVLTAHFGGGVTYSQGIA